MTNSRKNSNTILALSNDDNSAIPAQTLPIHLQSHSRRLLGRNQVAENRRPFDLTGRVGPQRTDELACLDDQISKTEVLQAIKDMPAGKSSGPDGIQIEFYKVFWNTVKSDIMDMIIEFQNKPGLLRLLNRASITLIPKK